MLATRLKPLMDNGLRNYLRRVPNDSVLYLPGLDYGNWYTGTIKDYSGKGNDGTITGAITRKTSSGLYHLDFDGSDNRVENDVHIIDAYPFTLSGWINISSAQSGVGVMLALVNLSSDFTYYAIQISSVNFYGSLVARNTTTFQTDGAVDLSDSYHFISGVFASATSRKLYVDGVEVAEGTDSVTYDSINVDRFSIGRLGRASPFGYVLGQIGLVHAHSIGLTATQHLDIYNQERHLFGV